MRLIKGGNCIAVLLQVIDILNRPSRIEILEAGVSISMRGRVSVARQRGQSMSRALPHSEFQGAAIAVTVRRTHIEKRAKCHGHIWEGRVRGPTKSRKARLGLPTPLLSGLNQRRVIRELRLICSDIANL